MSYVVAVDFDGTLCENAYPEIGKPKYKIINYVSFLKEVKNAKIILWTCRMGKYLDEAVEFCNKHGIDIDAVNENLPERVKLFGGTNPRKISADLYIDDKSSSLVGVNEIL